VWGLAATTVLTTLMAGSQGLGLTRMSLPYMLGTLVTPDRDRAKILGIGLHLVNGWLFALLYLAIFHVWGGAGIARGALVGAIQAAFVLAVLMPAFPGLHPRMAGEHHGPSRRRQLEPPGFLALNYGYQTPVTVLIAHVVYGAILGAWF
jgi:hypothetical protein